MAAKDFVPQPLIDLRRSLVKLRRLVDAAGENRLIEVEYPYSPKSRNLAQAPGGKVIVDLLERRMESFADLIAAFGAFRPQFETIALHGDPAGVDPFWMNGWLPGLDAASIYGLLATRNPSTYLEVGSGNSTKFARRAIADHGLRTKIVSIDPAPRAGIDNLCDRIIRAPFETVPLADIEPILADSVIFIDNSHRSFQNSDVTVFFSDLLPVIPKGSVWGLHDIFLPYDYPDDWTNRFYNEQYLLMSYLLGGAGRDTILLANGYAATHEALSGVISAKLFAGEHLACVQKYGGCFWMERG